MSISFARGNVTTERLANDVASMRTTIYLQPSACWATPSWSGCHMKRTAIHDRRVFDYFAVDFFGTNMKSVPSRT